MTKRTIRKVLGYGALALLLLAALAAWKIARREPQPLPRGPLLPPAAQAAQLPPPNPERNAYFGETHLHTSYSMDANLFGTRNDPRTAYRFAKGEEVEIPETGLRQRLRAPLDFAAVTDHAEGLGLYAQCNTPGSSGYWSIDCVGMRNQVLLVFPRLFKANIQSGPERAHYPEGGCGADGRACITAARDVWRDTQNAANEHYQPGRFTTLIGFEYSPTLADGGMIHRNVLFRGHQVPDNVFGASDGFAEDLLRWLDVQCKAPACSALAIPHNPNFSWGLMFGDRNADASPITPEALKLRARYETLVEVFQAKGSSECAAGLSVNDEQCGFENFWPVCTPEQAKIDAKTGQHAAHCVAETDLVRGVLKKGLQLQRQLGFNPYRFGFVGATDNHNGTPGDTDEATYKGHGGSNDGAPEQRLGLSSTPVSRTLGIKGTEINPGGLAGVWAEQNTREAIFDALQRRETWGTSGTRLRARLFGGFALPAGLAQRPDRISAAYASGVPMGGDLGAPGSAAAAPRFFAWAQRDVNSAPLQKLQIVKGWMKADGSTAERVWDIACSDGLKPQAGRCPANGATVDLSNCQPSSGQGAAELAADWVDPDFRSAEQAFYYLRVLENPVCRYSQRDALAAGKPHPVGFAPTIQERAWTSPIWYTAK